MSMFRVSLPLRGGTTKFVPVTRLGATWTRTNVLLQRRAIQTSSSPDVPEAFLEEAKPGISFLQLNRPKAKNAISLRLLKVRLDFTLHILESVIY